MLNYKLLTNNKGDNSLPTIVIIPGFTGNIQGWLGFSELLSQHIKYDILLIDNLGAGLSPQPEESFDTNRMAQEIIKIINHLEIKNIILIGHSLGGAIAQKICLEHSNLMTQLFLLSSFAKLDQVGCKFLINRVTLQENNISKQLIAESIMPTLFAEPFLSNNELCNLFVERTINNPQTLNGVKGQLHACIAHDTRNLVDNIKCKTHIITGKFDILVNTEHSVLLQSLIPNSTLDIINDCGHMIHVEQTNELISYITKYINYYHSRQTV